jgi:hypothetical protein
LPCARPADQPIPFATRAPGVVTGPLGGMMVQRDPMAAALV